MKVFRTVGVGVFALVLSGCFADVTSTVTPGSERVALEIELGSGAGNNLSDDEIIRAFTAQDGVVESVERTSDTTTITGSYVADAQSAQIVGVSDVDSRRNPDGTSTVFVEIEPPEQLIEAIRQAAAGRPDSVDLQAAALGTTTIAVAFDVSNGVGEWRPNNGDPVPLSENGGGRLVWESSIDNVQAGNLVVVGQLPSKDGRSLWSIALVGLFVAVPAALALERNRRRTAW